MLTSTITAVRQLRSALGELLLQLLHLRQHPPRDLHGVGVGLLADGQHHALLSVGADHRGLLLEGVHHVRHLVQLDRRAVQLPHHHLANLLDVVELGVGGDGELLPPLPELAAGEHHVGAPERPSHLGR
jgi:hypothetical protein